MQEEDRRHNTERETRQLEQIKRMFQAYVAGYQGYQGSQLPQKGHATDDERKAETSPDKPPYEQSEPRPPPDPNRKECGVTSGVSKVPPREGKL